MNFIKALSGVLAVLLFSAMAWADGMIVIDRPPRPVPGHYAFAPLEVSEHHVTVKIDEQVAVTEVDQTFYNPNDARLEGTYIFPIPAGAQIDKFSMDINGKQTEAELLDADKARTVYEGIVRSMKDPALLEYAGQGMFKARVFPIEGKGNKRIQLKYTEVLKADSGTVKYLYGLNTEKFSSANLKKVSVTAEIKSKQPITNIYCPSHSSAVVKTEGNKATVKFEATDTKPDTDFVFYYTTQAKTTGGNSEVGLSVLTYRDDSDPKNSGYFLLLATPNNSADLKVAPKDVVFVLDTSGSMAIPTEEKLDQAKKALNFCLANLNEGDRFQVIRFSTDVEPLFPALVEASKENRDKASKFVKDMKATGGTAIDDALAEALKSFNNAASLSQSRPRTIIFLTDGKPTIGVTDTDAIIKNLLKGGVESKGAPANGSGTGTGAAAGFVAPRVFCFGIGNDLNTHLLDKITEETHAVSQYVLPTEDIELKVSSFYAKINNPVLANVKAEFSGPVKSSALYPNPLPDLFKGDQLVLVGRYSGDGDAAITLAGQVNGESRKVTVEASFPKHATGNDFLPKLWATRRVGYLLDQIRLHGENAELKDEVTQLARQYGIVTPYTAYLIVEDEEHRRLPVAARTMAPMAADVRGEFAKRAEGMKSGPSGGQSVNDAQTIYALKAATQPAAGAGANWIAQQGWTPGGGGSGGKLEADAKEQLARAQQNSKYIQNRTFYQNGKQWVDSNAQLPGVQQNAKRQQIKFGSEEYFTLVKKHPEASQVFSLGKNLQVLLDETVYEIVDES